jgi:hypothetical protein
MSSSDDMDLFGDSAADSTSDNTLFWNHLPDELQEKFVSVENVSKMFPVEFYITDDGEKFKGVMSIVTDDKRCVSFEIMGQEDKNEPARKVVEVAFIDKKCVTIVMFDENGRDYPMMALSPLLGDVSDKTQSLMTSDSIRLIVDYLDLSVDE